MFCVLVMFFCFVILWFLFCVLWFLIYIICFVFCGYYLLFFSSLLHVLCLLFCVNLWNLWDRWDLRDMKILGFGQFVCPRKYIFNLFYDKRLKIKVCGRNQRLLKKEQTHTHADIAITRLNRPRASFSENSCHTQITVRHDKT